MPRLTIIIGFVLGFGSAYLFWLTKSHKPQEETTKIYILRFITEEEKEAA